MTDLSRVLPDFPTAPYAKLWSAIEKHQVTTSELLTLDAAELGKRTQLPLLDLKRLAGAVLDALHRDLGVATGAQPRRSALRRSGAECGDGWGSISTLDRRLDEALGGGVPTGYVTEFTGESGAGKTQFLLTLLLSAQLPAPHGLGRPVLYISTEAPLSTKRLAQILAGNAFLRRLDKSARPSLDGIISTVTPDLESQDHILQFQVPVEVARRNIGLIVLDSVAANYRVEFERGGGVGRGGANMMARSTELIRLGQLLHELARKHRLAVVVANQVADRFPPPPPPPRKTRRDWGADAIAIAQESPLASRSRGPRQPVPDVETTSSTAEMTTTPSSVPEPAAEDGPAAPPALLLDHQQRWFTGWGDDPRGADGAPKTPSLGLVWSTQLACRIVLLKRPVYGRLEAVEDEEPGSVVLRTWRRWMKVVFAPHAAPSAQGLDGAVEFEITMGGPRAVEHKVEEEEEDRPDGSDGD